MSKKHLAFTGAVPLLRHAHYARNNITASATALGSLASQFNHLTTYQKKFLFNRCQHIYNIASGTSGVTTLWRGFWRSSENTGGIRAHYGLVDTDYGTPAGAYFRMSAERFSDGATIDAQTRYYIGSNPGAAWYDDVANMKHGTLELTGFADDTEYCWTTSVNNGARLAYLSVVEIGSPHADDANESVVDPSAFVAQAPIYYQSVQDLSDAAKAQWRHNGCHLLSWAQDYDTAVSVSATSLTNILDGSSTTVDGSTPGFGLPMAYHNTTRQTDVPVVLAVHAIRTAGSGTLTVRVTNGTSYVEKTGIGTGGVEDWYTASGSLPASLDKFDVQALVSDGSTTFDLAAVSLYEYEA